MQWYQAWLNPLLTTSRLVDGLGASSHMTPHSEDLILKVEESKAVVQVANGVIIQEELRGTVQIRIQDLNNC